MIRGKKETRDEEDREACTLDECGHPFAVASLVVVESPEEGGDRLAGEEEKYIEGHQEPPLPSFDP